MGRLEGKVAVITGAASGIGAATARRFVAEGASVTIADIQDEVGEALATELGPGAEYQHCNVIDEDQVRAAIADTAHRHGRLDVVFNNAGFVGVTGPIEETTAEGYDMTMNVLLRSAFFGVKHAASIMKAQGSGSIISTASVCGLEAGIGAHVYTIAKAGVVMLTQTAALELAEHGVRVNCICPGYIATQLAAGRSLSEIDAEESASRLNRARENAQLAQPLHRMGEPEDIANMALFLASDESGWVTGTAQVVDGGLLTGKPWRKQPVVMTEVRPIRMYNPADIT
jgi:NAD(P)-dependent dehydrogenase (short-subunit alcohol dehydrogenase family)